MCTDVWVGRMEMELMLMLMLAKPEEDGQTWLEL